MAAGNDLEAGPKLVEVFDDINGSKPDDLQPEVANRGVRNTLLIS
jgi:hypothetical protein